MVGKKRKTGAAHAKAKKKNKKAVAAAAHATNANAQSSADSDVEMTDEKEPNGDQGDDQEEEEAKETNLLSDELRAELGGKDGDIMVLAGPKKKKKTGDDAPVTEEEIQQVQKLSKSKQKKMDALAARKMKEARREDLYKSLEQTQITQKHLDLMVTTSRLGHKETLKERLKRSMNREKAGLMLTDGEKAELYQQVETTAADEQEDGKDVNAAATVQVQEQEGAVEQQQQQQQDAGATTKTNKKKKQKARIATSFVPMMSDVVQQPSATPTEPVTTGDAGSAAAAQPEETKQDDAKPAPTLHREAATAAPVTSQSDAMAKLEALRKKNEERRIAKELAKAANGGRGAPAAMASTIRIEELEEVDPKDAYKPTEIKLQTTEEMLLMSQNSTTASLSYKTTLVKLKRKPEIQLARMQLPVCSSEQEIMEAITENDVVILCGETGSGKTTQVPQFLYEAGYGHPKDPRHSGRIGVTQPRRVAAVSTAKRVAEELNVPFGAGPNGHVGYQIRYDAEHVGDQTRIKFMTDGILLKEIQQDFLLRQYSILLLDEAHERNVNTDILIGLLSRIAPLRAQMAKEEQEAYALLSQEEKDAQVNELPIRPLKLVVMSATLRVEDFTENKRLFPSPPPVLRVEARQYPVTVHFNKRTELDDYVSEAYKKVAKIHKKLPEGGILVFLTGQREITQLCRQLKRVYSQGKGKQGKRSRVAAQPRDGETTQDEPEDADATRPPVEADDRILREHDDIEEEADLEDARVYGGADDGDDEGKSKSYELQDSDEEMDGSDSDSEDEDDEDEDDEVAVPFMHVLPLYSLLPNDEQMKVFDAPPDKHRLIVVATNVAETSLTIPGIKYVVDAGRTKERVFDLANGISTFTVQWISKASADQRAGRAGRTGPGHCYRLYSSAVYDTDFAKFAPPEILCQPIEDLSLQMKAMGIHNILQFPFPTPPEQLAIKNALMTLSHLGAITQGEDETITPLGRVLVKFPVAARFAKMLLLAKELGVLEYTIAIVAGLSGHTPFISALDKKEQAQDQKEDEDAAADTKRKKNGGEEEDEMEKEWRQAEELRRHSQWVDSESDVLSLLRAAGAYAYAGASAQFCVENHLHEKTMQNMLQLRQQLTRIVNTLYGKDQGFQPIDLSPKLPPPDGATQLVLRQIVAAGFLDQVAKRVPPGTITEGSKIERNCGYVTASGSIHEAVYIHPHSHVFTPDASKLPQFVVYQSIMRTSRAYMKSVTAVEPEWLAAVGKQTPLCSYSAPMAEPAPSYNQAKDEIECFVKVQYGTHKWQLPVVKVAYPETVVALDETTKSSASASASDAGNSRYKWFAKFLLDGAVVQGFQAFAHGLKEPSYMLIRKKFDKKIQLLVTKLQKAKVSSRKTLVEKWKTQDRSFLRAEVAAWYNSEQQAKFLKAWKGIVEQAIQADDKQEQQKEEQEESSDGDDEESSSEEEG